MQVEILALRHQLAVATRRRKRPSLGSLDRVLWVTFSRFWPRWRAALVIVKPETVIRGSEKGFDCIGVGAGQGSLVDLA